MKAATGNAPLPESLTAALRLALANPTRVCICIGVCAELDAAAEADADGV